MAYVESNGPDGTKIRRFVEEKGRAPHKHVFEDKVSCLVESYEWMKGVDSFKVEPWGEKHVRIRGTALTSNVVSRNNRKYVNEEQKKAARTLIGKAASINHAPLSIEEAERLSRTTGKLVKFDPNLIVGNIDWAEYNEKEEATEYLATIKKEPWVTMIKQKDPRIRGVSVQGDYLQMKCSRCLKPFRTEKEWHDHMNTEEFMKPAHMQPFGLVYTALSLVISPQEPGVPTKDFEIAESIKNGELRLCEMIVQEKGCLVGPGKPESVAVITAAPDSVTVEKHIDPESSASAPLGLAPTVPSAQELMDQVIKEETGFLENHADPKVQSAWKHLVGIMDQRVIDAEDTSKLGEATRERDLLRSELERLKQAKTGELAETEGLESRLVEATELNLTLQKQVIKLENEADHVKAVFKGREKPKKPDSW